MFNSIWPGLRQALLALCASYGALAQVSPLIYDAPAPSQEFVVSYTAQCGGGKPRVDSTETVPSVSTLDLEKLKCDWGAIVAGQMSFHAFNKPVSATLDPERRYAIPLAPTGDRNVAQGKFGGRLISAISATHFLDVWAQALPARIENQEKCPKNGSIQTIMQIPKPNGLGDVQEARGECELSAFYIDHTRNTSRKNDIGELISFETLQTNVVSVDLSASDGFGYYMGPGTGAPYIQSKVTLRTVHKFEARPRLELGKPSYAAPTRTTDSSPDRDGFYIRNSGGRTLYWQAAAATSSGGAWLKIVEPDPASGSLAPYGVDGNRTDGRLSYTIDPSILTPGKYTGTITVTADGAIGSPGKVEITLTVNPGTNDTVRITGQIPPASQPLQAGMETDVTVEAAYSLQTKDSGEIVLDVSAAGAATRTARAAITRGTGSKSLTVEKFAVPSGANSVNASVGLESGGVRLTSAYTSFSTQAARDTVQITAGSVQPDPSQPLQAGEETAVEARVQYALQTQAEARLSVGIYTAAQGGAPIASATPVTVNRGDPPDSARQLAIQKFTIPKDATELYLRAAILDSSDAVLAESPAVKYTVDPAPQISVSSIEAVQAVQVAAPGEVPLVIGRPTVVRAFVQQKGRSNKLAAGITGTLQVTAGGTSCTVQSRGSVSAHLTIDRNDTSHSLNFPVPAACLGAGANDIPVLYKVELELEPGSKETIEFKDNPKDYRSTLRPTAGADNPLRVRYLKVCLGTASNCPSGSFGGDAGQYLESLLPFQPLGLSLTPGSATSALYPQTLDDADPVRQAVKVSAFRMWLRRQYRDLEEGGDPPDMLVGLIPDTEGVATGDSDPVHSNTGGRGRVAFVMDHVAPQRRSYYLAHEVGHNLGLRHTNTDDSCPSKAADPNTNWIYSNGTINGIGWDHQNQTVIPSSRFDLMTYCVPASRIWISPFDFNQVFLQLQNWRASKSFIALPGNPIPSRKAAAPAEYLFIAGSARRDGISGAIQRGYIATSALPGDTHDSRGTHCLVFGGASGELARHCFPLSFDNPETGIQLDENFFEVKVPFPGGATRLDLTAGGRTLATLIIPTAAPVVSFVSPQAGEKWSGQRTLSWNGSDPAGGRLGYKLSYSSDDGVTWIPLAFDIEASQFTLDTGRLAGGSRVWFRVQASSGARTGEARVGPIEITPNPVLEPSRDKIDFGAAAAGAQREETLELRAVGSGPVKVIAVRTGSEDFSAISAPPPFIVPAGGSARVTVRFSPRQSGFSSSQLKIETDSSALPVVSIPLEGTSADAQQPLLVAGDDAIDFGAVNVGGALSLPLELRNAGSAALTDIRLSVAGSAFSVEPASVTSLAGGASATVSVKFAPAAVGPVTGALTISSNSVVNPELSLPLRGSGARTVPPPKSDVRIEISPATLDFGSVPVGTAKNLSLTVRALGNSALQLTGLAVDNPSFAVVSPAVPVNVAFGGAASVTVRFAPTGIGAQAGTLTIRSNASNQPALAVPLAGAGITAAGQDLELKTDDGTFERNVGYALSAGDVVFVNRLTPPAYPVTLKRIRVYFADIDNGVQPGSTVGVVAGLVASNADIGPTGARLVKTVLVPKLGQWLEIDVPAQTIEAGYDLVVGYTASQTAGQTPAALDTNSGSRGASFGSANAGPFEPISRFSGFNGNLGIRAVVTIGK